MAVASRVMMSLVLWSDPLEGGCDMSGLVCTRNTAFMSMAAGFASRSVNENCEVLLYPFTLL